ncbi:MAG: Dna2/Cas4 domain-containing protein [Ardenticatenia bacterium]|nr:MAG: Dna2/Cas4 domain-containing protein [Ardenticatenia bacterium]
MVGMAGVLLLLGLLLLLWGLRVRHASGVPTGRIVAGDTSGWRALERPLVSHRYRLTGRPDYLIQQGRRLIPVEVKPRRRAPRPYEGDLLQLWAYCLLVEETTGHTPPYGVLVYAERQWEIPFDADARRHLLHTLAELEAARRGGEQARSHTHAARCRRCGFRTQCSEALA